MIFNPEVMTTFDVDLTSAFIRILNEGPTYTTFGTEIGAVFGQSLRTSPYSLAEKTYIIGADISLQQQIHPSCRVTMYQFLEETRVVQ